MILIEDVYAPDNFEFAINFLYDMLATREEHVNISHKEMPTIIQHRNFVTSHPYKGWFLVCRMVPGELINPIGTVYLSKEDEIGIFLKKDFRGSGVGKQVLDYMYKKFEDVEEIYANISPRNSASISFFSNCGFKYYSTTKQFDDKGEMYEIVQYTYKIVNPQNFYAIVRTS